MTEKFHAGLGNFGWFDFLDEYVFHIIHLHRAPLRELIVMGWTIRRRTCEKGINISGAMVTLGMSFGIEFDNRIHRAWGAFWKFRSVLCAFTRNLQKVEILDEAVKSIFSYASES